MIYSSSFSVAGVNTVNTVYANLKAGSDRAKLLELIIEIETAPTTPPIFQLERMNAIGTGTITVAPSAPHDVADAAATAGVETAWVTTRPTRLATPAGLRRWAFPVTVGSAMIFDFTNRPIILGVNSGLLLVNLNASGATLGQFGGTFVWDE